MVVFHPNDASKPYYACIFTGLRRRHGASSPSMQGDEDRPPSLSSQARHQPGYLGGDDIGTTSDDDDDSHHHMVIAITYWSSEATMLKWRTYLEGSVVVPERQRHEEEEDPRQHTTSYADYHIHVAKIEPVSSSATPPLQRSRSGKVSPDRDDNVAPSSTTTPCSTSCHDDDDDDHHDAKKTPRLYHLPQRQPSKPPQQYQSAAEPPVTSPTHQHHHNKKQKTTTSRIMERRHLLTPFVDLPPVYDHTCAPLLLSSSSGSDNNNNNNNNGGEPIIPDNDTLSDQLRVFECFAQSLEVLAEQCADASPMAMVVEEATAAPIMSRPTAKNLYHYNSTSAAFPTPTSTTTDSSVADASYSSIRLNNNKRSYDSIVVPSSASSVLRTTPEDDDDTNNECYGRHRQTQRPPPPGQQLLYNNPNSTIRPRLLKVFPRITNLFAGNLSRLTKTPEVVSTATKKTTTRHDDHDDDDADDNGAIAMADQTPRTRRRDHTTTAIDDDNNETSSNSIFQYVIENPDLSPRAEASSKQKATTTATTNTRHSARISKNNNNHNSARPSGDKTTTSTPTKAAASSSSKTKSILSRTNNINGSSNKKKKNKPPSNPFEEIARDEMLHFKVAILMAMHSRRPASNTIHATAPPPPADAMIQVGFLWENFPLCERVLEDCAAEYFSACYQKLSQLAMRQLNDAIVDRVQTVIAQEQYAVHPDFGERKLRERIRCYYKTLIANAKKRLATLEKHRDDDENQAYLAIFLRCARDPHLTLRESVRMATDARDDGRPDQRQRWLAKVEQLRRIVEDEE